MANVTVRLELLGADGQTVVDNFTAEASKATVLSEVIGASETDVAVALSVDVSAAAFVYLKATGGDLTVETNDGDAPDDTISLVDGVPVIFVKDKLGSNPFSADVTGGLFVTSGADGGTLDVQVLEDATP